MLNAQGLSYGLATAVGQLIDATGLPVDAAISTIASACVPTKSEVQ
jgi:hypothetical protein